MRQSHLMVESYKEAMKEWYPETVLAMQKDGTWNQHLKEQERKASALLEEHLGQQLREENLPKDPIWRMQKAAKLMQESRELALRDLLPPQPQLSTTTA